MRFPSPRQYSSPVILDSPSFSLTLDLARNLTTYHQRQVCMLEEEDDIRNLCYVNATISDYPKNFNDDGIEDRKQKELYASKVSKKD
ncbi:hypothetical protein L2E82_15411 [Cichorium intybus]|uniref:Uncharacterized protein n=1 Tax=Cichorium intybus TaxID=13427 RepID=A0ACB9F3M8_CICIN|nr:hypothetical protein L2E82_15411 [Cichorium intybus]